MRKNTFLKAFQYAWRGIVYCFKNERNIKIHFLVALIVLLSAVYLRISAVEWCILFLTIALVITLEMVNTAVEKTVDLFTEEYHPLAEIAKNVAAGAVFFAALNAVIIGAVIFLRYIH